jgi:hypothetical protein
MKSMTSHGITGLERAKKDSQAHRVNTDTYPLTGTVREHALKRDVILSKDAAFFIAPLQKQKPAASLSALAVWQWRSTSVNRLTMADTVTINAPLLTVRVSVLSEISSDIC